MEVISTLEPRVVTPSQMRVGLSGWLDERRVRPALDLQCPDIAAVSQRLSLDDLLITPGTAGLKGYRLEDRGFHINEIYRTEDRIMDGKLHPRNAVTLNRVLSHFHAALSGAVSELTRSATFGEGDVALRYDIDLYVSLLRDSLRAPQKPRLVPLLIWPAPEDVAAAMKTFVPSLPWHVDEIDGAWDILKTGDVYEFKRYGERGDLKFSGTYGSETECLNDAALRLLDMHDFNDPDRFIFNPYPGLFK